jgi:hypothetical protein
MSEGIKKDLMIVPYDHKKIKKVVLASSPISADCAS